MKATIRYREKIFLHKQYLIEMTIHEISEFPYEFKSVDRLVEDFKDLVKEHLGLTI